MGDDCELELIRLENDALRAQLNEAQDKIEEMGDVMLVMAARLDALERSQRPPEPEISEWAGTVQWSGPSPAYWANPGAVNHEIAQEFARMMNQGATGRNEPESDRSRPIQAIETTSQETEDD